MRCTRSLLCTLPSLGKIKLKNKIYQKIEFKHIKFVKKALEKFSNENLIKNFFKNHSKYKAKDRTSASILATACHAHENEINVVLFDQRTTHVILKIRETK